MPRHQSDTLPLAEDFTFSQSSLQAYADCPRRFWLTYIERLPWPAVEAAPVQDHEAMLRLGGHYHRLIQRAEAGLDLDTLEQRLAPPLDEWFTAYRSYRPADLAGAAIEVECDVSITLDLGGEPGPAHRGRMPTAIRLSAKYDLVAATQDGRYVIVDWKTSKHRGDPIQLRRRLQSVVYPFVLVEAAPYLDWGTVAPEQVEMRYWFTAAPTQPVIFRYDSAQHAANRTHLINLLQAILTGRDLSDFGMAPDSEATRMRLCRYCTYRSRCNRGTEAGRIDELDDVEELIPEVAARSLDIAIDNIAELAF